MTLGTMHLVFKKRNLILVRNRNEIDLQKDRVYEDTSNHQIAFEHEAKRDSIQDDRVQEAIGLITETDNEQELRTVIRVEDKELVNIFNQILQDLKHCIILDMHQRERLPKLKPIPDVEESVNKILDEYLHGDEKIPEITDKVYAMGKAIAIKSGILQKQANYRRKNKTSNGNRRERS